VYCAPSVVEASAGVARPGAPALRVGWSGIAILLAD
jgi:hypothetical protein